MKDSTSLEIIHCFQKFQFLKYGILTKALRATVNYLFVIIFVFREKFSSILCEVSWQNLKL